MEEPGDIVDISASQESKPEEVKTEEVSQEVIKEEPKVEEVRTEPERRKEPISIEPREKKNFLLSIKNIYNTQYKKLLIIPIALFVLAIFFIIFQVATTGEVINKDVSLSGGVTITIPTENVIDISNLKEVLSLDFQDNDVDVRALKKGAIQSAIVITSDIDGAESEKLDQFIASIEKHTGIELNEGDYSVEVVGSSLGASFFKEIIRALIIAFIFMGIVVLIYFKVLVPGLAVIFAALSDIVITLAIVNLTGLKINTAGIAAFLMLIGYSVDTNILLSTKVLKRREGKTVSESIFTAMKTGLMMTSTTVVAISAALFFTQSEIIRQIMIILLIGLLIDVINTWIGNTALLRLYMDKKLKKNG